MADGRPRMAYIDNLRWALTIQVLAVHSAVTYGDTGSWIYRDESSDEVTLILLLLFGVASQAFFMGLFFLIAGNFAPGSLERKGIKGFIKERAWRLGIPALIYIFVVGPLLIYSVYHADNSLGSYYLDYLANPLDYESGPLWFAIALLALCVVYALVRKDPGKKTEVVAKPPTAKLLILIALFMALATFIVRLQYPIGTAVWNMQLCFFSQYITLFVVGLVAYRRDWFSSISVRQGKTFAYFALIVTVIGWGVFVGSGVLEGDDMSVVEGGLHWEAAVLTLWEQLFCVSMCVFLIVYFRERKNKVTSWWRVGSRNAFAVYAYHPPILVGLAILLVDVDIPDLAKFGILVMVGVLLTLALSHLIIRRLPVLKDVY